MMSPGVRRLCMDSCVVSGLPSIYAPVWTVMPTELLVHLTCLFPTFVVFRTFVAIFALPAFSDPRLV